MLQEKLTLVSLQRLPRFVSDRLLTDAKMSIFAVDFCHFVSFFLASALFPWDSLLPEPSLFDFSFPILLMHAIGGERVTGHGSKLTNAKDKENLVTKENNNLNFRLTRDQVVRLHCMQALYSTGTFYHL